MKKKQANTPKFSISVGNACECICLNCVCVVCVTVPHRFTNIFQGDLVNGIWRDSWCWTRSIKTYSNLSMYWGSGNVQFNMMTHCAISGLTAYAAETNFFFVLFSLSLSFDWIPRCPTIGKQQSVFYHLCLCLLIFYNNLSFFICKKHTFESIKHQMWQKMSIIHTHKKTWFGCYALDLVSFFSCYFNDYLMVFRRDIKKHNPFAININCSHTHTPNWIIM